MLFVVFFILAANFVVPGASQDLNCVLADAAQGAVFTVGVEPPSGISGKCLLGNPLLDVCYAADGTIYIAGPTSTIQGANSSMGGHIARIDNVTCEPEIIAEFTTACTAIGCDDSRLVFALEGVGIKSIKHDGSDEQDHGSIPGSFIRNIFLDISNQICYFVDITSSLVYSVDYTVNTVSAAVTIGITGAGAVASTVDTGICFAPRTPCSTDPRDLADLLDYDYKETKISLQIMPPDDGETKRDPYSALCGRKGKLVMGKNNLREDKLVFTFDAPARILRVSAKYRNNKQIVLDLGSGFPPMLMEKQKDDCINKFTDVTWTRPTGNTEVTGGVISFGDFTPSNEVAIKSLIFEVCPGFRPESAFAASATATKAPAINILYDDCKLERCPLAGPFIGCPVSRQSTGSQSCLPMSGTGDGVVMHDDRNTIFNVEVTKSPAQVETISSSAEDVVGMDCYFDEDDDDICDPNPCLNGGDCIANLLGYSCLCTAPYVGDNCENLCPECDFSTSSSVR